MKININIKRKFKIGGKEYNSLEEMPDDIRATFKKAKVLPSASEHQTSADALGTKIIFNDKEYENIDAMPQNIRKLYITVLKTAETGAAPSDIDFSGISNDMLRGTRTPDAVPAEEVRQPKFETSFSLRSLFVTVMVAAIIILLYYQFFSK